jgi:multiple sugar transport system permease protein/sn-glycerol 3-phosphate transport system permease protein
MTGARRRLGTLACHAVLLAAAVLTAAPLVWLVSLSLQEPEAVFRFPPRFIPDRVLWSSYPEAWRSQPFARMYWNSILTSTLIIAGQIATSCVAAYALTQLRFRGRTLVFLFIVSTMMVPIQATFIPAYILLSRLGWINTYWALVVPFVASGFGVFLMRQAFLVIPPSLVDAARIDGAGHWTILSRILFPLARPAVITLAALSFVFHYNDFFWPLIVTNTSEMRTLPVGLATMILTEGSHGTQWNQVMAADVFVVAPILLGFLFLQRYLAPTSLMTGVK